MSDRRLTRHRISGACLVVAAILVAARADAVLPSRVPGGEIELAGAGAATAPDAMRQQALSAGSAWTGFRAKHGAWTALWNEGTGTPHRAFGRSIALPGFSNDAAGVDRSVRRFIGDHAELFGEGVELTTPHVRLRGDTWYAGYAQRIAGYDVLFSDLEFRVGNNGRMSLFGADVHRPERLADSGVRIAAAAARLAARAGLAFDPARDRVEGGERVFLLPYPGANGQELRPVYETRVVIAESEARWLTYVDAASGEVLYRINQVRHAVNGTVTGTIHPTLPDDPKITRPLRHLFVNVGPTQAVTDTAGAYTAAGSGTFSVTAELKGSWADVHRADGALDAMFSTTTTHPSTVDIAWGVAGTSHDAERDAYYHVNLAHDHLKSIDPTLTTLDYPMPVNVNIGSTCNATWNGAGVNFFAAGGGCANTATVPDVVYHEYGHGVNDWTYVAAGALDGMVNGALHEGMADVNAMLIQDDPIIGEGFSGPGTWVRRLDQGARWPADRSGSVHTSGLIVAGAFWDLRVRIGLPLTQALAQEARHGRPDDASDINAFTEMFLEVLVADDNDANLANGTPNGSDIIAAFNAHGIGTAFYLFFNPVAVGDPPAGDLVTIESVVNYVGPSIASLDVTSPRVNWRVNLGTWNESVMLPTGDVARYAARIPVPEGSVVEYYLTATDNYGGLAYHPGSAPASPLRFYVGAPATAVSWNMEADPGWTITPIPPSTITGIWVRENPLGTYLGEAPNQVFVQPANDHTQPGAECFVTGNFAAGKGDSTLGIGFDDVDGGATTLTTATFDALTGMEHPIVEYWRWYSNNAGSNPGTDAWAVDISNNGGATWTPVENTMRTDASWQRILFRIEDYVTPTANMRMRFIASDSPPGSIIEAAVDDFRLLGFAPGTVSAPMPVAGSLFLAPANPNPSRGDVTFRLSLPALGRASLTLYDLHGRAVRTLLDGVQGGGARSIVWDGRDRTGRASPAGLYFARLRTTSGDRTQRVIRAE